jgi:hypothetical protein
VGKDRNKNISSPPFLFSTRKCRKKKGGRTYIFITIFTH